MGSNNKHINKNIDDTKQQQRVTVNEPNEYGIKKHSTTTIEKKKHAAAAG